MGFLVNAVIVTCILTFVTHPVTSRSSTNIYVFIFICIATLAAILIPPLRKKAIELAHTMTGVLKSPLQTSQLAISATAILCTNSLIVMLAAMSVGLHVSFAQAIIIMSSGVALGSIVPTPGGIGGVEAGLIAAFVAFGFDTTLATSATVIFRLATYVQPLLPGVWAYIYLRRHKKL